MATKTKSSQLLKAELVKAQDRVVDMLTAVIVKGKTIFIQDTEGGGLHDVAVIMPMAKFASMVIAAEGHKPKSGPYHVVNRITGKHLGPFTTEVDAALARSISNVQSWRTAEVMDKKTFDEHLANSPELTILHTHSSWP